MLHRKIPTIHNRCPVGKVVPAGDADRTLVDCSNTVAHNRQIVHNFLPELHIRRSDSMDPVHRSDHLHRIGTTHFCDRIDHAFHIVGCTLVRVYNLHHSLHMVNTMKYHNQ